MTRAASLFLLALAPLAAAQSFQRSDRCLACHNGLVTPSGADVSIGYDWRSTMMANSSRDPYWQAGVRRELTDHPSAQAAIEHECSVCHMPASRPAPPFAQAASDDGVNCSVCHQISPVKLGHRDSFSGRFTIDPPSAPDQRPEYGPFAVTKGHQRIMRSSSGGFTPTESAHIRKSEVCAACHTLFTHAPGPGGQPAGELPEQVPYLEWLHSDYRDKQSCQDCHMPAVAEPVRITSVFGEPRQGVRRHTFTGANFFTLRMLNRYGGELGVIAQPQELSAAAEGALAFLPAQSARIRIESVDLAAGRLSALVSLENLAGHKLPTAYPSRRAWIHFLVRDRHGKPVFESGALRPDGSIAGNDNDADAARFEPHYAQIDSPDQVQIYESIMGDPQGRVTTGLLSAVAYLKDNRILPRGFDKAAAPKDVAVAGAAAADPAFQGGAHQVRYSVPLAAAEGPFTLEAALWYQPIGFRWAQNLKPYSSAAEPARFLSYFDSMAPASAALLARATR